MLARKGFELSAVWPFLSCLPTTLNRSVSSLEVDESPLHIGVHQLHTNPIPHVDTLGTLYQFPFNGRIKKAYPSALRRCTRDDGIEPFPNSRLQQQRRCRFPNLPFHLLGGILLFRAVLRQRLQVIVAVRRGLSSQRSLQQPLGDDVGISAVGGCGMAILSVSP